MQMTHAERFRVVLYNVSSGIEFLINIRGVENYVKATAFLRKDPGLATEGNPASTGKAGNFFAVDDEQLAAFQAFLKQSGIG